MGIHVLIDGDNIQYETFANEIKHKIDKRFGTAYTPIVFCQTNVLIKYQSQKSANLEIRCSTTKNKNASDARMLFEMGKLIERNPADIIAIVSNDKIFEEICDDESIFVYTYYGNGGSRVKLKKANVMRAIAELTDQKESNSDDIFLCDLFEHMGCKSLITLRDYINKFVPEVYVTNNDAIFFVEKK